MLEAHKILEKLKMSAFRFAKRMAIIDPTQFPEAKALKLAKQNFPSAVDDYIDIAKEKFAEIITALTPERLLFYRAKEYGKNGAKKHSEFNDKNAKMRAIQYNYKEKDMASFIQIAREHFETDKAKTPGSKLLKKPIWQYNTFSSNNDGTLSHQTSVAVSPSPLPFDPMRIANLLAEGDKILDMEFPEPQMSNPKRSRLPAMEGYLLNQENETPVNLEEIRKIALNYAQKLVGHGLQLNVENAKVIAAKNKIYKQFDEFMAELNKDYQRRCEKIGRQALIERRAKYVVRHNLPNRSSLTVFPKEVYLEIVRTLRLYDNSLLTEAEVAIACSVAETYFKEKCKVNISKKKMTSPPPQAPHAAEPMDIDPVIVSGEDPSTDEESDLQPSPKKPKP